MTSVYEKHTGRVTAIFFPSLVTLLLIVMFIVCSDTVKNAVTEALSLSVASVIPSVFPCALLSAILASVGGGELFGRLFGKPLSHIFGTSREGASAVLLGILCGFPIGAVTAFELYKSGTLSEKELFMSTAVSSLPSPAFVTCAVGGAMLGNKLYGLLLYAIVLLSGVICANVFSRGKHRPEHTHISTTHKKTFIDAVVSSVPSAVSATLNVTAYIVFFSALCACISDIALFFHIPTELITALHGFLEISGGCADAARLTVKTAFPMCAAFLGFSGMSVHFQIISATDGGIPFGKYFLFMLLRGILCFLLSLAVVSLPFVIY